MREEGESVGRRGGEEGDERGRKDALFVSDSHTYTHNSLTGDEEREREKASVGPRNCLALLTCRSVPAMKAEGGRDESRLISSSAENDERAFAPRQQQQQQQRRGHQDPKAGKHRSILLITFSVAETHLSSRGFVALAIATEDLLPSSSCLCLSLHFSLSLSLLQFRFPSLFLFASSQSCSSGVCASENPFSHVKGTHTALV